jgi:hypothetical protein
MRAAARSVWVALVVVVALTRAAAAERPKLTDLTHAYANQHGLPVRVVKTDLGTREIEREFVPVLPTTHESFLDHFKVQNGAIVWRTVSDAVHPTIAIAPGKGFGYYTKMGEEGPVPADRRGFYLTLAVNEQEVAHWEGFVGPHIKAGQQMYTGREVFRMPGTNICHGSCMWWLVHGELAPGVNLATAMGVRRAKGPEILAPRLIHAGNERVGPIGVPVATLEEFNKLTDEQLLGPEPAGGAAEQVKP